MNTKKTSATKPHNNFLKLQQKQKTFIANHLNS